MRALLVVLAVPTALASCATQATTIFSCAGAPTVAATYAGETAELRFGNGERIKLPLIPSEVGERYSDGNVSWFTSGRDAVLFRDGNTIHCDALASP